MECENNSTHLDTPRAAEFLGLSGKTLNKLRCVGGGPPFYKFGRSVRYRIDELSEWARARRRTSTSDPGQSE